MNQQAIIKQSASYRVFQIGEVRPERDLGPRKRDDFNDNDNDDENHHKYLL